MLKQDIIPVISLIFVLIGISILIILTFRAPLELKNSINLEDLNENQKILVSGKVIEEKTYASSKTLVLNNSFEIICNGPCPPTLNKNVKIIGIIDDYNNKKRINALKIVIQ